MTGESKDLLVVLGPTASGKTALGVRLARAHGGEVISADSRQVYRGLDIGAGKDLDEYRLEGAVVPHHLIDVVDLDHEFSVFEFQKRFFHVLADLRARHVLPVVVGGTGLYLEAVLKGYRMVEAPRNPDLRAELAQSSDAELVERLNALRDNLHNTTDLRDRSRLVRAIEIAAHSRSHEPEPAPSLNPLIIGTRWPRRELYYRIGQRLRERLGAGLIEEVEGLRQRGVTPEKLRFLGLEYRFVSDFLNGSIRNENDLYQKLNSAIRGFAKRQETWFRRMERNGTEIRWVDRADPRQALSITQDAFPVRLP